MAKQTLEKILIVITITGLILKLLNIKIGGVFFILSINLLSIFYFIATFFLLNHISIRESIKRRKINVKPPRIVGTVGFGIGLSAILIGIMFNILNWPGSSTNLYFGLFVTLLILIVSLIRFAKSKLQFYLQIIIRGLIYAVVGFTTLLLPDYWSVKVQYKDYPDYQNAVIDYYTNPSDTNLLNQMNIEYEKINK